MNNWSWAVLDNIAVLAAMCFLIWLTDIYWWALLLLFIKYPTTKEKKVSDLHTCSYYCDRPECIKAQRDELRAKYSALLDDYEKMANQAIFNNDFKNRLAQAIEQMPFGDTATSLATFVREFK